MAEVVVVATWLRQTVLVGTANTGGGGGTAGGITGGGVLRPVVLEGLELFIRQTATQAASTTGSPVVTTVGIDYVYII